MGLVDERDATLAIGQPKSRFGHETVIVLGTPLAAMHSAPSML